MDKSDITLIFFGLFLALVIGGIIVYGVNTSSEIASLDEQKACSEKGYFWYSYVNNSGLKHGGECYIANSSGNYVRKEFIELNGTLIESERCD